MSDLRPLEIVLSDALHAGIIEAQISEDEHAAAVAWLAAAHPVWPISRGRGMTDHEFQQTIFGKDADDIQAKAEEAIRAYFGTASEADGVKWSVDSEGRISMTGKVIDYEGRVRAWRV